MIYFFIPAEYLYRIPFSLGLTFNAKDIHLSMILATKLKFEEFFEI